MPLIPNYIARLRTHSQSTAASSSSHSGSRSNSTAGPSTPGSELARLAGDVPEEQLEKKGDQRPRSRLARKIHPNLSALLDEDVTAEGEAEESGPRPPRGRSRSAEQLGRMTLDVVSQQPADPQVAPEPVSAPPPSTSSRSPLLSRIFSVPLLSGVMSTPPSNPDVEADSSGAEHWSTFGRRRPHVSAMGEFGRLHRRQSGSKSSARSKSPRRKTQQRSAPVTPSTTRSPSSSARASAPSRPQTIESIPSQQNSPTDTISSRSPSQSAHSHSMRSRRPPLAHPEPIPDAEPATHMEPQTPARTPFHASTFTPSPETVSPLPVKPTLDNSPHTFGRSTPKGAGSSSRTHPSFSDAFVLPLSDPRQQHKTFTGRDPAATYPKRTRKRTRRSLVSFPSLPSLPRKLSAGRLRAEDVFLAGDQRRLSASWSATEAVRDGDEEHRETWPATVSREMVRLSLAGGRDVAEKVTVDELGTLTDGDTKNVTRFGSTGEDIMRFMMAMRKRTISSPAAPAGSSSAVLQHPTQAPAFAVSPPTGSVSAATSTGESAHGGLLAPHVSVTAPTPSASPSGSRFGTITDSAPQHHPEGSSNQGKRKIADAEDDESPRLPNKSILSGSTRDSSNRASDASHAPSSFRQPKRIRLSTPSEHLSRSVSHSSRLSSLPSPRSRPPSSIRTLPVNSRTISQSSIPLRAIVSPRPPSVERRSIYYMRDPALPPPLRQSTQWTGSARKSAEEGRRVFPLQGWAFMLGFVLFPMWWAAAIAPVGWGWGWRTQEAQDGKGKSVNDEDLEARQIWEYDVAFTWRRRCRLMSILGLFVYVPIIVLLAVLLVPRT